MIRTVEDIEDAFRSDVFDRGTFDDAGVRRDTLWSEDDVLRYLNSACARLASDTLAIRRRFAIPVAAGQATVRFPYEEILEDLQVSFIIPGLGRRRYLRKFDLDDGVAVDDYGLQVYTHPDYDAVGTPTHFTRDWDNTYLRLWHVPFMAGTLEAHAIAIPAELHPGMPLPFAARQDFDLLLLWMKHMAYAKQDADTLDLSRSGSFLTQYMEMVKHRKSEIDRNRRDGGIVRPS